MPKTTRRAPKRRMTKPKSLQVAKIAKQVVTRELKKKTELKFFDSNEFRAIQPQPVVGSKFSCIGFSSTDIVQPDSGVYQYPAGTNITALKCLQPFKSNDTDTELRKYILNGRECNPITARCKYVLNRTVAQNVNDLNDSPPPTQGLGDNICNNFPVLCRVITVVPKLASSINTECNPSEDLFMTRYGTPTGVDKLDIDNIDIMVHPVNKRRYHVKQDFKFKLQTPFAISWTANNPDEDRPYLTTTTPNNDYCQRLVNTYYQLAERKGGKVFYVDPNVSTCANATSGHQRTYTLFHFQYMSIDSFASTTQLNAEDLCPTDLAIDVNTVSRFTDA
jgi:hypothetical protein